MSIFLQIQSRFPTIRALSMTLINMYQSFIHAMCHLRQNVQPIEPSKQRDRVGVYGQGCAQSGTLSRVDLFGQSENGVSCRREF
jgi:hypothetical protein